MGLGTSSRDNRLIASREVQLVALITVEEPSKMVDTHEFEIFEFKLESFEFERFKLEFEIFEFKRFEFEFGIFEFERLKFEIGIFEFERLKFEFGIFEFEFGIFEFEFGRFEFEIFEIEVERFKFEKWVSPRRRRLYRDPLSFDGRESFADSPFRARVPSCRLSLCSESSLLSFRFETFLARAVEMESSMG